jgi:hypothetical protein
MSRKYVWVQNIFMFMEINNSSVSYSYHKGNTFYGDCGIRSQLNPPNCKKEKICRNVKWVIHF